MLKLLCRLPLCRSGWEGRSRHVAGQRLASSYPPARDGPPRRAPLHRPHGQQDLHQHQLAGAQRVAQRASRPTARNDNGEVSEHKGVSSCLTLEQWQCYCGTTEQTEEKQAHPIFSITQRQFDVSNSPTVTVNVYESLRKPSVCSSVGFTCEWKARRAWSSLDGGRRTEDMPGTWAGVTQENLKGANVLTAGIKGPSGICLIESSVHLPHSFTVTAKWPHDSNQLLYISTC